MQLKETFKNKNQKLKKTQKIFCFRAYSQILKVFHVYFQKKIKLHFYHILKKYKNRYCNQFLIIH